MCRFGLVSFLKEKRGCGKNQQPLLLTKKNTYEVTNIEPLVFKKLNLD